MLSLAFKPAASPSESASSNNFPRQRGEAGGAPAQRAERAPERSPRGLRLRGGGWRRARQPRCGRAGGRNRRRCRAAARVGEVNHLAGSRAAVLVCGGLFMRWKRPIRLRLLPIVGCFERSVGSLSALQRIGRTWSKPPRSGRRRRLGRPRRGRSLRCRELPATVCFDGSLAASPRGCFIKHLPLLLLTFALAIQKGTKLHFKLPTAERRHVLCVGVGGDRTHASRP
jgi:hypothetical protein